jgi:hypothetical protein
MMKRRLAMALVILSSSLFFSACSFPFIPQKAGVQITSSPQAEVFLNDKSYSDTPLIKNDLKAGEYTIKIIPKDPEFLPWEGQLSLKSGIITVVDRILSTDPNQSNGHSLSFESIKNKDVSELDVITLQNNTAVSVDGNPVGFTPLSGSAIDPGPHIFTLTSPGYQDKIIKASVISGFKLIIAADLAVQEVSLSVDSDQNLLGDENQATTSAQTDIERSSPQASSSAISKPYIKINQTPQGWLRVRSEPEIVNDPSNEIARVNTGDLLPYLDTKTSWFQIEYQKGKKGWVSSSYATLVE